MAVTRIKLCGFTRATDVRAAVELGVDLIGLNLARGPRKIGLDQAAALAREIPPGVTAVALFVDADEETILTALSATRCTVVQLHGRESPELAERLARRVPVIRAASISSRADLEALRGYPADALLLDAAVPGQHGGTGTTWDLGLLAGVDLGRPIYLAGGLGPANVAAVVAAASPFGVDAASGVESTPGRKDPAKMSAFVHAVRGTISSSGDPALENPTEIP